jgi:uncharacterized lipoprotein YddW (UPF0748 family)
LPKVIILLALLAAPLVLAQQTEVRAMWVQRGSLTSPASILALVESAKASGFNTLLVQVRGRGDAYYRSRYEPRAATLARQPADFDPLSFVLAAAHRANLKVHAWMNVNLVSDATLPAARQHVVYAHPEWLMVPRPIAADLAAMSPRSRNYLDRLAQYARARSDRIEGVFLSPLHKGAVDYTVKVIADLASTYAVDGVHLDYIRFPNDDFDYSAQALNEFREDLRPRLTRDERRDFATRAQGRPLFYTEMFPQRWQEFRRARLTDLLTRVRAAVKSRRPGAILSAAVFPDAHDATTRRFQDWGAWLHDGLLDAICPMAYTTDPGVFRAQIASVEQHAGPRPVWAGIGAFQLSPGETVTHIRAARQLGVEGVVLFSYDNLNSGYVERVAEGAFAK